MNDIIDKIRLLALDSDGVLTDGGVYFTEQGQEFRRFHIHDGLGLRRLMDAGIQVAVISSSKCQAVHYRMKSLGIEQVYLGVDDKLPCLQMICQSLGITLGETAYMGDDLPDLPVLKAVAFPCAPADAAKEVLKVVQYVSEKNGGHGAVRQVCDMLLNTR